MIKKVFNAIIFLCLPVAILTIALIRKQSVYHGLAPDTWFQEVEPQKTSPATEALIKLGQSSIPTLQAALEDSQNYPKIKACWVLQQMGPAGSNAVPRLVSLLGDKNAVMRIYAMQTLTAVGTTKIDLVP